MKLIKLLARIGAKLYDYSCLSYTTMDKLAAAAIERREETIKALQEEQEQLNDEICELLHYRI